MVFEQKERQTDREGGAGGREKTEVKRYIWLNGRFIRRVLYLLDSCRRDDSYSLSEDKRSSSVTDLLGQEEGCARVSPSRSCDCRSRGEIAGDVSRGNLNWTVRRSSPS